MIHALSWPRLIGLLLVGGLLAPTAHGKGATTWYRCTNAAGVITLQNGVPCPAGNKQEKRVTEAVQSLPTPAVPGLPANPPAQARPPAPPAPAPAGPTTPPDPRPASTPHPTPLPLPDAQSAIGERLPPPPLFECRTYNNDRYLSDDPMPKQRCAPMDTVGIDGNANLGAGAACSMQTDQCQRVPDGTACDAWRTWVNQAQATWIFARAEHRASTEAEYQRVARVIAETTCNTAP